MGEGQGSLAAMTGRKLGWSADSGAAMLARSTERELLNELCRCAATVARNYIDCGSHYEYFGNAEDIDQFRFVLRQATATLRSSGAPRSGGGRR